MHRPASREIMFAKFKPQPKRQPAAPRRSNSAGSSHEKKKSAVLIQRLIILHDGLMPLSDDEGDVDADRPKDKTVEAHAPQQKVRRRNPQAVLSEDASLEEHGEFILYYYNHSTHANRGKEEENESKGGNSSGRRSRSSSYASFSDVYVHVNEDHCTEEAVKFAGVVRALRSLPLALHPQSSTVDNSESEETEVVHLSDSMLVFVPLELNGDVVAVVQIPRADNHRQMQPNNPNHSSRRSNMGYGADPNAIRDAVRYCHALFSMLYGGGIHRRLLQTKHLEKSDDWYSEEGDSSSDVLMPNSTELSPGRRTSYCYGNAVVKELFDGLSERRASSSDASLSGSKKLSASYDRATSYCYGGMKELFELRCKDRKYNNSTHDESEPMSRKSWKRRTSFDSIEDMADQMDQIACQDRIDRLMKILPISSVRNDVKAHYDDWLAKMQGMCAVIEGGVGRSIVEMVPTLNCENSVRGQHLPVALAPFVRLAAAEFMQSLLDEELCTKSSNFQLVGVSFFHQSSYMMSRFLSSSGVNDSMLPPETVCMIAQYLKSQQRNDSRHNPKPHLPAASLQDEKATPAYKPLDRWLSNISVGMSKNDITMNGHSANHDSCATTGFISPPGQGINPAADSIFIWDLKYEAWLPRLFISQMVDENHVIKPKTPVTLFAHGDYSFLLFFSGVYSDEKSASELLSSVESRISGFCDDCSANVRNPLTAPATTNPFAGEPGMDIIFVNREDNTFLLSSQHELSSNDFHRKTNATSHNGKGIFGLGFIKETCERENEMSSLSKSSTYTSMLDCRHKLAAYLPLDVMLAFDDMFNEIGRLNSRKNILEVNDLDSDENQGENTSSRNRSVELCTYLPQGWVYGRAEMNCELYVLLDTRRFVTISDVTKAVTRVREKISNDKLE
jgi:hypothetical protein